MVNLIDLIQEYNLQELVTIGTGFSIGVFESIYENILDKKFEINISNENPSKLSYSVIGGILIGINKNSNVGFASNWDRAICSGILGTISYSIGYSATNKMIQRISNNNEE